MGKGNSEATCINRLSKSQGCRCHQPGICSCKILNVTKPWTRFEHLSTWLQHVEMHPKLAQGLATPNHNLNFPWTNPGMDQCNTVGSWFSLWIPLKKYQPKSGTFKVSQAPFWYLESFNAPLFNGSNPISKHCYLGVQSNAFNVDHVHDYRICLLCIWHYMQLKTYSQWFLYHSSIA